MAASKSKHPDSTGCTQELSRYESTQRQPQASQLLLLVGSYGVASLVFAVLAVLAILQGRDWIWIISYVVLATASIIWVAVVVMRQRSRMQKQTHPLDESAS
ncbi:MAG: hypothetical protein Q3976_08450 [Corynebacterium sp.]|nr:hypothetical protein [Corynebacterium sp.]